MSNTKRHNESALKVNKGIEKPSMFNSDFTSGIKKRFKKEKLTVEQYFSGIRNGDKAILSRAITLIESTLPEDKKIAKSLINRCLPYTGNSLRIGITGVPGVGAKALLSKSSDYRLLKKEKE